MLLLLNGLPVLVLVLLDNYRMIKTPFLISIIALLASCTIIDTETDSAMSHSYPKEIHLSAEVQRTITQSRAAIGENAPFSATILGWETPLVRLRQTEVQMYWFLTKFSVPKVVLLLRWHSAMHLRSLLFTYKKAKAYPKMIWMMSV